MGGKRMRRPPAPGDLFLISQSDGHFTLGQVLAFWPSMPAFMTVALFGSPVPAESTAQAMVDHAASCSAALDLLAVVSTGKGVLQKGQWRFVAEAEVTLPSSLLPEIPYRSGSAVGGITETAPLVDALVEAFRGLEDWDLRLPGRPGYLRSLVFDRPTRH